jgi:predicted HicB family RNase H-like nuclease
MTCCNQCATIPVMERMTLTIRIPEDVHAELKAAAEHQGISLNATISLALRDWINREREASNGSQK